jgi:amino acid transporter
MPLSKNKVREFALESGRYFIFYVVISTISLSVFIALFKIGAFSGIKVLFYRGIVIAILIGVIVFIFSAILAIRGALHTSMALAAAAVSTSINLTVLIIFPVTIDRSVTVFLLGHMAHHPQQSFSAHDLESHFIKVYLGTFQQMQRRMDEQELSGNIQGVGAMRYRISPQGEQFIAMSRTVAWAFGTDSRFVDPDNGLNLSTRNGGQANDGTQ